MSVKDSKTIADPDTPADNSLAGDILRGAAQIGDFIGLDEQKAFHKLEKRQIPADKEGRIWVSTKSRLRRHDSGRE